MATTSAAATNGITLVFNPTISGGQYTPGQVYDVTVSANGGQDSMLGSTFGSWENGGCTKGDTVGIEASTGMCCFSIFTVRATCSGT